MTSLRLDERALSALVEKYRAMVALRLSHARGMPSATREELQRLATAFPGALAELDRLPTTELLDRLTAVEEAAREGSAQRWMLYVFAFHAALREALLARGQRGEGRRTALEERRANAAVPIDEELIMAVERPPGGRLVPAIIEAVARWTGGDAKDIDAIVRPPRRPR